MQIDPFTFIKFIEDFVLLIFVYLKYILFIILISIGSLTFLKLRGIYLQQRAKGVKSEEDQLKDVRLILGTIYIFLAFGILFNHLIYFFIWILEPLPDGLIFIIFDTFSEFSGFNMDNINRSLHPLWGLCSFIAILQLFFSLYFIINNNRVITVPKVQIFNLISSIAEIILFGFTTCLPYLLNYY